MAKLTPSPRPLSPATRALIIALARHAAANPKAVLELLDRIAELEGALMPFAEAAKNFDSFPIKDATEWFAYGGQSSGDSVRHGAISVADLRRAAELVKP